MHIVMLLDVETVGGAAMAANRLAEAICQAGHQVTQLVGYADGQKRSYRLHLLTPPFALARRIVRRLLPMSQRDRWDNYTSMPIVQTRLEQLLNNLCPDIINLHNLHGAVTIGWSPNLLRICANHAPTVWTLHDMWSFTGRCAYSYDCRKFLTGCDDTCPTPMEYPPLAPERIGGAWEQRRRLLVDNPLVAAVTPSRWLAREAQAGLWAGHRVEVIPNGLPLDVYRPLDRTLARQTLKINTPDPVLLVAASKLTTWWKGVDLLLKALQQYVMHRPLTLVALGAGKMHLEAEGIHLYPLGLVNHEQTMVLAYNAADLFIHPAVVDNLPNVVMEAIACGTPVVGFPIGGVPDMVRPGQTGWLADEVSSEGLGKTIDIALGDVKQGLDLRHTCRAIAKAEYSADMQAHRYLSLCQSLCDKHWDE